MTIPAKKTELVPRPERGQLIPDSVVRPPPPAAQAAELRKLEEKMAHMQKFQPEQIVHEYVEYRVEPDRSKPSFVMKDRDGKVVMENGKPKRVFPTRLVEVRTPGPGNVEYHADEARVGQIKDAALVARYPANDGLNKLEPPCVRTAAGRLVHDVRQRMMENGNDIWDAIATTAYADRAATLVRCFGLPDWALVEIARAINDGEQGGLAFVHETLCRAVNEHEWRRPFFLADNEALIAEHMRREFAKSGTVLTAQGPKRWFVNGELVTDLWKTGTAFRAVYDDINVMEPRTRMRARLDDMRRPIREALAEVVPHMEVRGSDPASRSAPALATSPYPFVVLDPEGRELKSAVFERYRQHTPQPKDRRAFFKLFYRWAGGAVHEDRLAADGYRRTIVGVRLVPTYQ